jgi:uncharacterized protein (TIGR03437 family)
LPAGAQNLAYNPLPAGTIAPTPRVDGTIVYDRADRQVFLFGGQSTSPQNDLWAYSLRTNQWRQVQVTGAPPPARFGHTLILDTLRRRLIVFGGQAGGFFSDVWAFDIATSEWRRLASDDAGPSRRYGHSAIYDAVRGRMVVSHGFTNSGRFDDTWAFDLRANVWTNISPATNRPLRRCLHHAAYDPTNERMYLYGGCASGAGPCPLGDLWSFDLTRNTWTELRPAVTPPAREHYGMTFDTQRARLRIFGGAGPAPLNDSWEFDPISSSWQRTTLAGNPPAARSRHEATYAPEIATAFYFGGDTAAGPTNELWSLSLAGVVEPPQFSAETVVNAFSYHAGAVAPGEIVSIFGRGLGPLNDIAFSFDPVTGMLPTSGPGVTVTWNGVPGAFYFARADQLNVQVPYALDGATEATLSIAVNGRSTSATIPVAAAHPGLAPVVFNGDLSVNSAGNPSRAGDIVVLFATGDGLNRAAAAAEVRFGGVPAEILFFGPAPGTVGVTQINARLVPGTPASDRTPVVLAIGEFQSPPVTIAVK